MSQNQAHAPTRAVLLLHAVSGEPDHCDLLLERPPSSPAHAADPDDHRLISFRLEGPVPDLTALDQSATRTPDHRAHYLTHQGPISGARGRVRRILTARIHDLQESATTVRATLEINAAHIRFEADHLESNRWRLQTRPA